MVHSRSALIKPTHEREDKDVQGRLDRCATLWRTLTLFLVGSALVEMSNQTRLAWRCEAVPRGKKGPRETCSAHSPRVQDEHILTVASTTITARQTSWPNRQTSVRAYSAYTEMRSELLE